MRRTIINADNMDLQPLFVGPFVVGHVDNVNGPGAHEVPEYLPTRAELLEVLKYWEFTFLDTEYWVFTMSCDGSTEMRLGRYAKRRSERIVTLLGDDAVKAVCEVRYGFAKGVGAKHWKEFCEYLGADGPTWIQEADPYRHPELTRFKLVMLAFRMIALAFLPPNRWRDGCRPWDIYEYDPWYQRVSAAFRKSPPYDPKKMPHFDPPF
jgi:hypothetical protein